MDKQEAIDHILTDRIVMLEFTRFFLGDYLGKGVSRYVFDFKFNKNFVVKIDISNWNANNAEYNIWEFVQHYPNLARWFAPVDKMSRCGRVLLQRKCKTDLKKELYPKKIPTFIGDVKYDNFGMLNGKIVCLDYSLVDILQLNTKIQYKKAEYIY